MDVLFNQRPGQGGDVGEIMLNRPAVLNALTPDMCKAIRQQLLQWQADPLIKAVVVRGAGDRAFCAGGDIKLLYHSRDNIAAGLDFFRAEYEMNIAIHYFTKPYISFLDGLTMGGGAGVSLHGSHRVATEHFQFSMPETGIGFFCDVGSGYFLNKCPGHVGYYLGLTGERINAADALMLNIVSYYVPRADIEAIIQALCMQPFEGDDMNAVSQVIQSFSQLVAESRWPSIGHLINDCFGRQTVEAICDALDVIASPWADRTLRILTKRSPTSLKVTLLYLQISRNQTFEEIMDLDFNLAYEFIQHNDFYEGIRAALIDKDHAPHFNPAKIADVSDKQVARFFSHRMRLIDQ